LALNALIAAFIKIARQTAEERRKYDLDYHKVRREEKGSKNPYWEGDISLKPHQERFHRRLQNSPGVLAYHGLGSGKTISAITAAPKLGLDSEVVVPAALRPNYRKELDKVQPKGTKSDIKSYEGFTAKPNPAGKLLIFDEAHRLQDPETRRTDAALNQAPKAAKRIALTGTPIQNHPDEVAPLLNTVAGREVLPTGDAFRKRYIKEVPVKPPLLARLMGAKPGVEPGIHRKEEFAKSIRGLVDYHPSTTENYPRHSTQTITVPMSSSQRRVYDVVVAKNAPWSLRWKMEHGLPPSKSESANLNAFLSGARIVSNTPAPFQKDMDPVEGYRRSPKLQKVVADLLQGAATNPRFKGLVYSNYLDGGVRPVAVALKAQGVPHHIFYGGLSDKVRKNMVEDYNAGKVKALLISGAGAEGLDLKGTRMVQILEPHWNQSRLRQVVGRAIRYGSHAHLPENERHVDVRHYHAVLPKSLWERLRKKDPKMAADPYLHQLAAKKQALIDQFLRVMQEEGSTPA
jgi:SNF2 family DNA or RNA helicase